MDILDRLLYGPNVLIALMGAAGVLTMFLALFAIAPSVDVAGKIKREERPRTSLQVMLDQANLPITAGEFVRTAAVLGLVTGVLGYGLLRTVTGAVMGLLVGPLVYWGYLGNRRDKTRRQYQEALARVATIVRDVIGRGGGLEQALRAVAGRGPTVVQGDFTAIVRALDAGFEVERALEPLGGRRRDAILTMLLEILMIHRTAGSTVRDVLDRLAKVARRRADLRKRLIAEQARIRMTARIVSIAPFIMLAIFRGMAPGLVIPYYRTIAGEITMLVAGAISVASYALVMRVGNRPLKVMQTAFVGAETGARARAGSSAAGA